MSHQFTAHPWHGVAPGSGPEFFTCYIEMVPTGGVNLQNVADFLRAGACAVAVGSEMVNAKALAEGRLEVIEETARQFLVAVQEARRPTGGKS